MNAKEIKQKLLNKENPKKALLWAKFFKTGKGEYGDGDIFLGLTSQEIKNITKSYENLDLIEIKKLLEDEIHECRMAAIIILIKKYPKDKESIVKFYLDNSKKINNWDLVDVSCHKIVGDYLIDKDKKILYKLAESDNLWEKRIAVVSTYAFIRKNDFECTLKISKILLNDSHDLIHKAVGWMLREVGKRDEKILKNFLKKNYKNIPRTALRYAIEKFKTGERKKYLQGDFNEYQ